MSFALRRSEDAQSGSTRRVDSSCALIRYAARGRIRLPMAPLWPDHAVLASGALQSADALAVRLPPAVIFSSSELITARPEVVSKWGTSQSATILSEFKMRS